jgi:hypothetical protein
MYLVIRLFARRVGAVGGVAALALASGQAGAVPLDGSGLQRMCQGADKVKALSMMCYSYLNGYLDTVAVYEKGKTPFCIREGDKEHMPSAVVDWMRAHPEAAKDAAPLVLKKALSERYPCGPGK